MTELRPGRVLTALCSRLPGLDPLAPPLLVEWVTAWTVDGVPPVGADARGHIVDAALSPALTAYVVAHGRGDVNANVEATTCTATLAMSPGLRIPKVGESVRLALSAAVSDALGLVLDDAVRFTGEVTDRQLVGPYLTVVMVGRRARLGRLDIGDVPWPAESDGSRAQHILDAAKAELSSLQLGTVDVGTVQVLARDVDKQPALSLIDRLADTAAGQLVERRTGELQWHDAEHRRNLSPVVELTADQLLGGLQWSSGIDGMVNTLTLTYGVAPVDGERPTAVVVDEQQAGPLGVGPIAATLDTDLALDYQAGDRARLIVGRRSTAWWDTPALSVDLIRTAWPQLPALLTVEHGEQLRVTGLPKLGPFPTSRVMVEGYTESMTPTSWQLVLAVADVGIAAAPTRWDDVAASMTWDTAGELTWLQAARWQPESDTLGRWLDVSADTRWSTVDPAVTWTNYS